MTHGPKSGRMLTLAATIAFVLSAPAFAGDHSDRAKVDVNGDGKIDLGEAQAARPGLTTEKFNAADANHDGHLSQDEWSGWPGEGRRWGNLDADQDGNYTLEELRKTEPDLTQQEYSSFDANKDGKVTKDELKLTIGAKLFDSMDKDRDGSVSLDEMHAVHATVTQEKFARMDADGNGLLSKEEMRAAHRERHDHDNRPAEKPAEPPSGS